MFVLCHNGNAKSSESDRDYSAKMLSNREFNEIQSADLKVSP